MRRSAGFTLLELMTVLAIMGILVAVAVPSFGYLSASTKVKAASTELFLAMIRARSESVKRNRSVAIVKSGTDWQAGWQVVSDGDKDGLYDNIGDGPDDDRLVYSQGELKRVTITEGGGAIQVVFRPSGRISEPAQPAFEISAEDQDRGTELKRCVTADLMGKPYTRKGACP